MNVETVVFTGGEPLMYDRLDELDKYCREALPGLKSNRKRIKKRYTPKEDKIEYVYPKKWNI